MGQYGPPAGPGKPAQAEKPESVGNGTGWRGKIAPANERFGRTASRQMRGGRAALNGGAGAGEGRGPVGPPDAPNLVWRGGFWVAVV